MSKTLLRVAGILAPAAMLPSCLMTHQRVYHAGQVYEDVALSAPAERFYRGQDKLYVRGERRFMRRVTRLWWDVKGNCDWKDLSNGQRETVYRELSENTAGEWCYATGSAWQPMDATVLTPVRMRGGNELEPLPYYATQSQSTSLSWLTTPASYLTAVCVDIPVSVVCWACAVPANMLFIFQSIQQQQTEPDLPPTPVQE